MNSTMESVVTIALGVLSVATIALIVSRNAATSDVIRSAGQAFSGALGVAVSPVTGGGGGYAPSYGGFGGGVTFGGGISLH